MLTFREALENNQCPWLVSYPPINPWRCWMILDFRWAYPSGPFYRFYHLSPFCAYFFRPGLVNLWFELFPFLVRCMALRCEIFLNLQLDWNCASRSWCNFIVETVRLSTVLTVSRTVSAIWRVPMLRSRGIRWQRRGRRRRRILIWRSPHFLDMATDFASKSFHLTSWLVKVSLPCIYEMWCDLQISSGYVFSQWFRGCHWSLILIDT